MHSIKTFDSFEQGVYEIVDNVNYIGKYFVDESNKTITTYDEMICHLLNIIGNDIPSVENPDYPYTYTFNINAREVSFNIPKSFSFGWRTYIDSDGNIKYTFRISSLDFKDRKPSIAISKIEDALKDAGWDQIYTYEYGKDRRERNFFKFAARNNGMSRFNKKREQNTEEE